MPSETVSAQSGFPLDPRVCLQGIRQAYFASTSLNDEDLDPETLGQMTDVEEQLLVMLQNDDDLDPAEVFAKVRRASLLIQTPMTPTKSKKEPSALHSKHAFPCSDTYKSLPSTPSLWPQAPLMIRPTPNTSTTIRGIRRARSLEYEHFSGFCAGCILPINCGSEAPGESLVVDFESTHFVGTLLMRIKQAKRSFGDHKTTVYQDASYFDGKKRKFQAVVKGRFKTPLPMSQTVTGQTFDRPAGKLPARWIVTSFIKFVSTLAPQLEARLDGDTPRFLTPLVATAHTFHQTACRSQSGDHQDMSTDMEDELEEPPSSAPTSVLPLAQEYLGISKPTDTTKLSIAARMKARKRILNSLTAKKDTHLTFRTDQEYTFEFYQHLLDFGEGGLAIDMGRPIGKVGLAQATDGQPLKFMSAHTDPVSLELDTLWSFDIWHASLYPYADMAHNDGKKD